MRNYCAPMSTREQLIKDIEAFIKRHGLSDAEFGILALNDSSFVLRVKRGMSPTLDRYDRVRRFMDEYKSPLGRRRAESRSAA